MGRSGPPPRSRTELAFLRRALGRRSLARRTEPRARDEAGPRPRVDDAPTDRPLSRVLRPYRRPGRHLTSSLPLSGTTGEPVMVHARRSGWWYGPGPARTGPSQPAPCRPRPERPRVRRDDPEPHPREQPARGVRLLPGMVALAADALEDSSPGSIRSSRASLPGTLRRGRPRGRAARGTAAHPAGGGSNGRRNALGGPACTRPRGLGDRSLRLLRAHGDPRHRVGVPRAPGAPHRRGLRGPGGRQRGGPRPAARRARRFGPRHEPLQPHPAHRPLQGDRQDGDRRCAVPCGLPFARITAYRGRKDES